MATPGPAKKQEGDKTQGEEKKSRLEWEDVARPAAALALLTTFLSALAVSGVLDQAQRNHSWWLYVAAVLVVTAGVLWALSLLVKNLELPPRWILAASALVLAAMAVLVRVAESLSETVTWSETTQNVVAVLLVLALVLGGVAVVTWLAQRVIDLPMAVSVAPVLSSVAVAALAAGLLSGMVAVVQSQKDAPRPAVTASIKDGPLMALTANVTVQDISWDKHVRTIVDAITWKRHRRTGAPLHDSKGYIITQHRQRLYSVWLGPDKSGDVNHKIELVIPPTLRDELAIHAWVVETVPEACSSDEQPEGDCPNEQPPLCNRVAGELDAGCLRLRLLPAPSRPRISAGLKRAGDGFTVSAKVHAQRMHEGRMVSVRMLGYRAGAKAVPILSARINPDESGAVAETWEAALPSGLKRICVAAAFVAARSNAQTSAARPACPPRAGGSTAWTVLVVPLSSSTE